MQNRHYGLLGISALVLCLTGCSAQRPHTKESTMQPTSVPAQSTPRGAALPKGDLILCGWDEVALWRLDPATGQLAQKTWSWRARGRADLPKAYWGRFDTTDECKPSPDGRIVITSSGGAVAVVDRRQDKVVFYAAAGNLHSAELLPGNRLAVAASHAKDGSGDRLIIYDLAQPEKELYSTDLTWGHGVLWDAKRQQLWALSIEDIRVYSLLQWDSAAPQLTLLAKYPLPENDGHDLYPIPGTPMLSVTTKGHCWQFNRDTGEFSPHPLLGEVPLVKCICQHPQTGQVVYTQGSQEHWWSEELHFLNPERTVHVPGEHFYKARWNAAAE